MVDETALEGRDIAVGGLYRHGELAQTEAGALYITLPERVKYVDDMGNTIHYGIEGEYLLQVVCAFYRNRHPSPMDLVELVAQFQPSPIIDTSIPLEAGQEIVLPSLDFIESVGFGDSLSDFPEL